jgi:hypothetical protein
VLAQLRDLDPGPHRLRPAASGDRLPRRDGLLVAAHPAQRPRPLGADLLAGDRDRGRQRRPERPGGRPEGGRSPARLGRVEAGERVVVPLLAGEAAGEGEEVAGRSQRPPPGVRVLRVEVLEEPPEGPHVLGVVLDDGGDRLDRAAPHERQVALGDLPARHVLAPVDAQHLPLHRLQPRVPEAVPEQAADVGQEVQVAGVRRRRAADHPVARREEGPVEAAAVVRHEPGLGRDGLLDGGEERRLVAMVGAEELELPEAVTLPPAQADEEGERAGSAAEAGRLRVEADQGDVGRRLTRQGGQSRSLEGDRDGGGLDAHDVPLGGPDGRAVHRRREARGERRAPGPLRRPGGRPRVIGPRPAGGPEEGQPPGEQCRVAHAGTAGAAGRAGGPCWTRGAPSSARSRRASRRASRSASAPAGRGPVHDGQPVSQAQAAMRSAAPATSSSWRHQSRSAIPTPPGTAS